VYHGSGTFHDPVVIPRHTNAEIVHEYSDLGLNYIMLALPGYFPHFKGGPVDATRKTPVSLREWYIHCCNWHDRRFQGCAAFHYWYYDLSQRRVASWAALQVEQHGWASSDEGATAAVAAATNVTAADLAEASAVADQLLQNKVTDVDWSSRGAKLLAMLKPLAMSLPGSSMFYKQWGHRLFKALSSTALNDKTPPTAWQSSTFSCTA
jgi:hypothetical protein